MNPLIKEYLSSKYGPNYEKEQEAAFESAKSRANLGNLFGDLGDVVAGRQIGSTDAYFQNALAEAEKNTVGKAKTAKKEFLEDYTLEKEFKKSQQDEAAAARENDPNSEDSKLAQNLAIKMGLPPEQAQAMTAARFKTLSPVLQKTYEIEQKKMENALKRQEMQAKQAQDYSLKLASQEQKQQEKEQKKMSAVTEIQDRYQNIQDSIGSLKKLIDDYGTQEVFGGQNEMMDQYITSIATDMAKLVDPNSVARETEVDSFKRMLVKPGFWQRESSMQAIIDNFKNMVDKRLENAYQVRGLDMKKDVETKEINGETYVKVEGGWRKAPKVGNNGK